MGQTETRFFIFKCHPPKKCSSHRTFHLLNLCEKEFMHEAGDGNGQVLMQGTVNQNDGLCQGHLVLPIADSTRLILTLIDVTGRRCLVQPFWVLFFFFFCYSWICISLFKYSEPPCRAISDKHPPKKTRSLQLLKPKKAKPLMCCKPKLQISRTTILLCSQLTI